MFVRWRLLTLIGALPCALRADYRNTGKAQNVEFHMRRDRRGELRQGVYVSATEGVSAGQELLIS
eukprot:COSAG05_NODE_2087_length_3589_cov_7.354728_5_plen_65_part_00